MGAASQIEGASLVEEATRNESKDGTLVDYYERAQQLVHRQLPIPSHIEDYMPTAFLRISISLETVGMQDPTPTKHSFETAERAEILRRFGSQKGMIWM